ncbi:AMP-binding protein [Streptomyces sp. NPDC003042]
MTQGSESTPLGRRAADPADTVLHHFERWARDTPGAHAVIAGPDSLTYGQLDLRANWLAYQLLDAGLPAGGLVAVGTARQSELVVALLAVLKAGGAYAVIDVEVPRTGQRQLAAAPPFALLTHASHRARLDDGRDLRVIRLGAEAAGPADRPTGPPARPRDAGGGAGGGGTAAWLFTGAAVPRAVPVSHARLLAAYESWAEVARLTPQDRHLVTTGTDITAFAAGWTRALCSGGALVLPEHRAPWQPDAIRRAIEAEQVTVVHTDPAGASRLLLRDSTPDAVPRLSAPKPRAEAAPRLRTLRLLTVTGERLHLDEQASLQARLRTGVRLLNVYGLTETAGAGTWFELPQLPGPVDDPEQRALLGTPFPGFRAELRAGQLHLTPPDGGDAIPTGDLARLRPDGLLEFGGRIRDRVTLDGRTLDPHALESAIRTHEGIGAAIVAVVARLSGTRRLVVYVAPPPGEPFWSSGAGLPDIDELREHLVGRLPFEEWPRALVRLRALPRNRAGQEDRAALPQPAQAPPASATGGVAGSGSKYGPVSAGSALSAWGALGCGVVMLGLVGLLLTNVLWPGSTDLTGVPNPWAWLFRGLYLFELLAFGAGVLFLLGGRPRMLAQGRGRALTTAAHLAVVYLLVAWWPQDNLYRLAAKQDWPRQAALVYTFNIPLMIAAGVVALYLVRKPASPFDFDD